MSLECLDRFARCCSGFGVDASIARSVWKRLETRYGEPHRYYHNLEHIKRMLEYLDRSSVVDPSIELAIWFHDVIYDPLNSHNEEDSADWFSEQLGRELSAEVVSEIVELILATDPKVPRKDKFSANLLVDIDLSILGSEWDQYDLYRTAIRKEYSAVPKAEYVVGRTKVLTKFLSMPIYFTADFLALEAFARANISRELNELNP